MTLIREQPWNRDKMGVSESLENFCPRAAPLSGETAREAKHEKDLQRRRSFLRWLGQRLSSRGTWPVENTSRYVGTTRPKKHSGWSSTKHERPT